MYCPVVLSASGAAAWRPRREKLSGLDIIPFLIIQVFKSVSTIQKVRTVCLMIYHTNIHTKVAQTS